MQHDLAYPDGQASPYDDEMQPSAFHNVYLILKRLPELLIFIIRRTDWHLQTKDVQQKANLGSAKSSQSPLEESEVVRCKASLLNIGGS